MARINDLTSIAIAPEDSVVVVTDSDSSKKITVSDLRNTLVKRASTTVSGTIKIGSGLAIDDAGVVSVSNYSGYTLPKATNSSLGGVIAGSGLSVDARGVLTVLLPPPDKATTNSYGVVKVGAGLSVSNGVISNAMVPLPTFIVEGNQTITEDFTTSDDKELYSIGPITIDRDVTFTVAGNATWVIYTPAGTPADEQKVSYFQEGNRTVLSDLSIESGKELYSVGPVTIERNATLTIEKGATWIIYDIVKPAISEQTAAPIQESSNMIVSNYTIADDRTATSYGTITIDRSVTVEISPLSTWIIF